MVSFAGKMLHGNSVADCMYVRSILTKSFRISLFVSIFHARNTRLDSADRSTTIEFLLAEK